MHYSNYNHLVKSGESTWKLHNFLTGKTIDLDPFGLAFFNTALEQDENSPVLQRLLKLGFIVDYDELAFIKTVANSASGMSDEIHLVLCPTLGCNFACPYCFENAKVRKVDLMPEEVQKAIANVVDKTMEKYGSKRVHAMWYGGEPLLGKDVIKNLSKLLIDVCEKHSAKYSSSIITNGYLLDEQTVRILEESHVVKAQITIDGPREIHNKTRILKSGGGSFDRIIENISSVKSSIYYKVRCNLNKDNVKYISELSDFISSLAEKSGNNIELYTCGVWDSDASPETGSIVIDRSQFMVDGRVIDENTLGQRRMSCSVIKLFSMVVDCYGKVYKCEETVGDDSAVVGNILDFKSDMLTGMLTSPTRGRGPFTDYLSHVFPFDDEECINCKVLPICLGGCVNARLTGRRRCNRARFDPDLYVLNIEKINKRKKEGEQNDEYQQTD